MPEWSVGVTRGPERRPQIILVVINPVVFPRDITNMKGTIVAQVDSSESFQEFCSTGCLGAYENKQNPPKSGVKSNSKCTVCGKLTEVSLCRLSCFSLLMLKTRKS